MNQLAKRSTPPGWPRISTTIFYEDALGAIDWLCEAFGFAVVMKIEGEGGALEHSELTFGTGMVMVAREKPDDFAAGKPPSKVGGANTQCMMVYVDDIEAHLERALAAGATLTQELETHDYGDDHWADRGYQCRDVGGHHWWFFERLRTKGQDEK